MKKQQEFHNEALAGVPVPRMSAGVADALRRADEFLESVYRLEFLPCAVCGFMALVALDRDALCQRCRGWAREEKSKHG